MNHVGVSGLAGLAFLAFVGVGQVVPQDAKDKGKGKSVPGAVPIELRLTGKKTTYTLDLGGQTAAEFKKQIKDADETGKAPPPPIVDLALEFRNTSDKDVQLWIEGDATQLVLDLKGPAAVNNIRKKLAVTLDFRVPKTVTVAAGKSFSLPVKSLANGFRNLTAASYWLEAGDYTLTASYKTALSPAPKGSTDAGDGFGTVTLTSSPLKLKVQAK
jgi:hypothetical protein